MTGVIRTSIGLAIVAIACVALLAGLFVADTGAESPLLFARLAVLTVGFGVVVLAVSLATSALVSSLALSPLRAYGVLVLKTAAIAALGTGPRSAAPLALRR